LRKRGARAIGSGAACILDRTCLPAPRQATAAPLRARAEPAMDPRRLRDDACRIA